MEYFPEALVSLLSGCPYTPFQEQGEEKTSLREVIRLPQVTQLYVVEAGLELSTLVSGSQALSPIPVFPGGRLALSQRMAFFFSFLP